MDASATKDQVLHEVHAAFAELGLQPTRERTAITKAFRAKAKLWHPDKHPEPRREECEAKFKSLTNARDTCNEASGIEMLMRDLESWQSWQSSRDAGVGPARGGAHTSSSPPGESPGPTNRRQGAQASCAGTLHARRGASQEATVDNEWKVFVDHPSAYFNLFTISASAFVVTALVSLISIIITVVGVAVAVVVSLVVMFVSFILSALAIAIPVIGWIAIGAAGIYLLTGILQAAGSAFEELRTFVGAALARTAYPRKALRFTWWASNFGPIVLALPFMSETLAAIMFFYFIVNNACFSALSESLGESLARVETEYEKIRKRHTETALVVRAQQRFGDSYSAGAVK